MKPRPRVKQEKDKSRGLVPCGPDAHLDTQYSNYLKEIKLDSDPVLQTALAASKDIRFRELLRYLALPSAKSHPLIYWVKRAEIDLAELMTWMSDTSTARALAVAQQASPKINSHMAVDAESRMVACERCDGLGFVSADAGLPEDVPGYRMLRCDKENKAETWIRDCPMGCDRGKVRAAGDEFAREKLLEQAGLINKKGPGFQLVQHFGGQSMPSAVGRLDRMTLDIEPG
jgi:hypothetical protein